jgi:hypothetical protein
MGGFALPLRVEVNGPRRWFGRNENNVQKVSFPLRIFSCESSGFRRHRSLSRNDLRQNRAFSTGFWVAKAELFRPAGDGIRTWR